MKKKIKIKMTIFFRHNRKRRNRLHSTGLIFVLQATCSVRKFCHQINCERNEFIANNIFKKSYLKIKYEIVNQKIKYLH